MKKLVLLLALAVVVCSCGTTHYAQFEEIQSKYPGKVYLLDKKRWLVVSDSTCTFIKWNGCDACKIMKIQTK